jgi:hypothetical protein
MAARILIDGRIVTGVSEILTLGLFVSVNYGDKLPGPCLMGLLGGRPGVMGATRAVLGQSRQLDSLGGVTLLQSCEAAWYHRYLMGWRGWLQRGGRNEVRGMLGLKVTRDD